MANKKEVATKQGTELALGSMYEEDANSGFEQADKDAYAIPFLNILQSGSPQCKKSDGAYIKGAEEGMLFNNVAELVYDGDDGVAIIPVYYQRVFIEWKPRDSGGGFVAEHSAADGQDLLGQCFKNDKNQDTLPNGNLLVDTRNHYALMVLPDGSATPVVISLTSTQLKKSRKWMSVMQGIKLTRGDGSAYTPPMFSHSYTASTVPESNDQGSWFGWKFAKKELIEDANLYNQAKAFRDAINSGEAKAAPPQAEGEEEEEAF